MTATRRRLDALKTLLAHVRDRLQIDLGFALWDGSSIPLDLPAGALALAIADEGVVAALIRRPKLETLLNLVAAGRLELRNGTMFDLVAQRPRVRIKNFLKVLDKKLVFAVVARFLFVSSGGPWPLEEIRGDRASRDGTEAANRANIQYHYDLSNEFYALFLDPEMVYSCGHFTEPHEDLARAQRDKLDLICRKLRLKPNETLLDIGCGWSALPIHAARYYGVRAYGVTLSEHQYDYATDKIARLGLQDWVTVELNDYSSLEGSFDKIASVGMFEHVGNANYIRYFSIIHRLLKPGDSICITRSRGQPKVLIASSSATIAERRRRLAATSFPAAISIISECPSRIWSDRALRCMTSRLGACITRARHGCGTIAYWPTGPPLSARWEWSRPGYGSCIWPAFRSDSIELGWVSSRPSHPSAGAAPPMCHYRAPIFIASISGQ